MDNNVFTETTSTSWFSRIGNSIKGLLFGGIFIVLSIALLWWNEGRSVKTAKGLDDGEQVTVEAEAGTIDPAMQGKLVHVTGKTAVKTSASDAEFGLTTSDVIKLKRRVEVFQWVEDKSESSSRKIGGGEQTTTEYRYNRKWDEKIHDSSRFKHPQEHQNPPPRVLGAEFLAPDASLGAFRLPDFLLSQWRDCQPHKLPSMNQLPQPTRDLATLQNQWLVLSKFPDDPRVGDARVRFESIKTGDASVLARQVTDTFEAYATPYGTSIARITSGIQSKQAMFAAARKENKVVTWLLRAGGLLLMFFGFLALFQPLKILADILPLAGSIVGAGTGLVAFLLAAMGTFIVVALAWLWYRPVIGVSLLLLAGACLFLLFRALHRKTV
jgi:hypothetical protein